MRVGGQTKTRVCALVSSPTFSGVLIQSYPPIRQISYPIEARGGLPYKSDRDARRIFLK